MASYKNCVRTSDLRRIFHPTLPRLLPTLSKSRLILKSDITSQKGHPHGGGEFLYHSTSSTTNISSWNVMIGMTVKGNNLEHALKLFDEMPLKDVVSWNTVLSGLSKAKKTQRLCSCFLEMCRAGYKPDERTFSIVMSAVVDTGFRVLVQQIHALVLQFGLGANVFVGSALIKGYANAGNLNALGRLFEEILVKNVACWNALVSGYMELGCVAEAQAVLEMMPEKNVISWTNQVRAHIRNKCLSRARSVFDMMSDRNVISWTVMISGYVQGENFKDALELFVLMLRSGSQPNQFTISSLIDACAASSCNLMGQLLHSYVLKAGVPTDVVLSTSFVDMYTKCGEIDAAISIFESMPKNLASWNSMIGGYARNGLVKQALDEYGKMIRTGLKPDQVTFINILSACAHGGFVEEGESHFKSMAETYAIQAEVEHYACMVDLYGRAGKLEKAEEVIREMPMEPDEVVWGALLGACSLYSDLNLGEFASNGIKRLGEDRPVAYSVMSRIHAQKGSWDYAIMMRAAMRERKAKQQLAGSWVQSCLLGP